MEDPKSDLPISYFENNQKEEEILYLAKNYQRQFRFLYPQRPEPTLYLENECNMSKLICTYFCPIKITKTAELREWNECAVFLADYVEYTPLTVPTRSPRTLHSLDSVLKRRSGNSLEMSMILCTMLLASDFDAYVAQGYATREVTKKIEGERFDPIFSLPKKFKHYEKFLARIPYSTASTEKKSKYDLDFEKAKKYWIEGEAAEVVESVEMETKVPEKKTDILYGKRVHFWVLLRLSKDRLSHPIFLEPSTGEMFPVDSPEYLGIEFVWNDKNFWNNNQKVGQSCKGLKFEFEDYTKWDAFLPEYSIHGVTFGKSTLQIRMPETWIRGIEITQNIVDNRFPPNGKHIRYKTSKVAKYNPHTLKDGLVFRIIYYNPENLSDPLKSLSFYSGRKDCLEYRAVNIKEQTVTEMFSQNREDALKSHQYHLNNDPCFFQTMEFFSYLRTDGLSLRKWTEEMTTDTFTDRSDFLLSREVKFKVQKDKDLLPNPTEELKVQEKDIEAKDEKVAEIQNGDEEIKQPMDEQEIEDSKKLAIGPSSFDNFDPILENVDFSTWELHQFLEILDPAERYATSEPDSEEDIITTNIQEHGHETPGKELEEKISSKAEDVEVFEKESVSPGNSEGEISSGSDADEGKDLGEDVDTLINQEGKKDTDENDQEKTISDEDIEDTLDQEKSEEKLPESIEDIDVSENDPTASEKKTVDESEGEGELELYDDINFDALSDEELEIDYQLYLNKIWDEYSSTDKPKLFYMEREFYKRKDMQRKRVLKTKKKIIRKRRTNVRFIERKEMGKPSVRIHKRKSDENLEALQGQCTDALIMHLNLKAKLGIPNLSDLKEFHVTDLEKEHIEASEAEIIKKESMKLLDKKLKTDVETEKLMSGRHILYIKHTYLKDPSSLFENSIQNIWFLFETNSYRIDFHCPEGKSTCRTLIFTKPESESSEFTFSDYLCRQITPIYEKNQISRPRLYSYLIELINKESITLRENSLFEHNMKQLLAKRAEEMKVASSFKERSGWKAATENILEAKNV
ncbi:dynein regulatory complex subunit 7 [Caerostris darwini]|uniref:Dynein regulatory complex subunit 7 n=1 Tax=Caerostris darwini TaxID=1538125 RepID=A0AAV4UAL9_9ARAC|nr:dynein regulatory complex subunit 7 [Caerostris darwini]